MDKDTKKFLEKSFSVSAPKKSSRIVFTRKGGDEKVVVTVDAGNPEWLNNEGEGEQVRVCPIGHAAHCTAGMYATTHTEALTVVSSRRRFVRRQ